MALSHPDRHAARLPASITGTDDDDFDAAYNGGAGAWDARVDLDLSGTLTSADDTLFTAEFVAGEAGGYRVLSRASLANRLGYAGYQHAPELAKTRWHVRHRVLDSETGRWLKRDPIGYVDRTSLYEYCLATPLGHTDPSGLIPPSICHKDTDGTQAGLSCAIGCDRNTGVGGFTGTNSCLCCVCTKNIAIITPDPDAQRILAQCTEVHESINVFVCKLKPLRKISPNCSECMAYNASLACLVIGLGQCGTPQCLIDITEQIVFTQSQAAKFCGACAIGHEKRLD